MYEVEMKVPADHDAVRDRLGELDAENRETVEQADTYYNAPHRDFAETDEALRIRRETVLETGTKGESEIDPAEPTRTVLTYKGPLVDAASKTRREAETDLGDGDVGNEILAALDFSPVATVRKERAIYAPADGEWTATLDTVEEVGAFVEVELEADEEGIDAARERVREVLERLDLDPDDQIRTSYLELVLGDNAGGT